MGILFAGINFHGQFRNYAAYLEDVFLITNYNIISNIVTAIWILPVYIIQHIFSLNYDWHIYENWRKVLLICSIIITSHYIKKIVLRLGYNEVTAELLSCLYLMSPAVLFANLALGQVDCLAVMFIVFALYQILKGPKAYPKAMFFLGCAMTIKVFALFFVVMPLMCIVLSDFKWKETLKCIVCGVSVPFVSWVLSHKFFYDYALFASLAEDEWSKKHIEGLFKASAADTSLFLFTLMVVCLIVIFKSRQTVDRKQVLFYSSVIIVFAFHFFCPQHSQWFIYGNLALLFLGLVFDDKRYYLFLLLIFNFGIYLFGMTNFPGDIDVAMFEDSFIARAFAGDAKYYYFLDYCKMFFPKIYIYFGKVSKTLLSGCT